MYYTLESLRGLEEDQKKKEYANKRSTIDNSYCEIINFEGLCDVNGLELFKEPQTNEMSFEVGKQYSISGQSCDGFSMTESVYEMIGEVNEYSGMPIKSLILKYVSGRRGVTFALSKHDCESLNVDWKPGLILLPKSMNWKKYVERVQTSFNPNDMGSYPLSGDDLTIRHILIKISGFNCLRGGKIVTPWNTIMDGKQFEESLSAKTLRVLCYNEDFNAKEGCVFECEPIKIKSSEFVYNNGNCISSNGELFLHINIRQKVGYTHIGIDPRYVQGLRFEEVFDLSYCSANEVTRQVYEENVKKEKEKEEKAIKDLDKKMRELNSINTNGDENSNFDRLSGNLKDNVASIKDTTDSIRDEMCRRIEIIKSSLNKFKIDIDDVFKDITFEFECYFD